MRRGPPVFQIGFNKCGTTSIHRLLTGSGIPSLHWERGELASTISRRILAGQDPILDYPRVNGFTDMISTSGGDVMLEPYKWFEYLHRWHPAALFILNTRNRENWIDSRLNHVNTNNVMPDGGRRLAQHYARYFDMAIGEVPDLWRHEWEVHHAGARAFFRGSDRFLEFNIETDDSATMRRFLEPYFPQCTAAELGWHNRSQPRADHAPASA